MGEFDLRLQIRYLLAFWFVNNVPAASLNVAKSTFLLEMMKENCSINFCPSRNYHRLGHVAIKVRIN